MSAALPEPADAAPGGRAEEAARQAARDPRDPGRGRSRRPATAEEAKALGHPLRLRILRLCRRHELTNKQLADRLGVNPGTVHHHVRLLADAGLLQPAPVRAGEKGALEKPYTATSLSWWLEDSLAGESPDARLAPFEAFRQELEEAGGGEALRTWARFTVRLSPEEARELEARIQAILDEYVATDDERPDRPLLGGFFALHDIVD